MKRRNLARALAVSLAGASLGLVAPAAQALTIVDCGMNLASPGTWVLKDDIECDLDQRFVRVTSDRVTIDLQGHTVTLSGTATGVLIENFNHDVTVKNGKFMGGVSDDTDGVVIDGAPMSGVLRTKVSKVTFESLRNGVVADWMFESRIEKSRFRDLREDGVFFADASGNDVKHNKFTDVGENGVFLERSSDNDVQDNEFTNVGLSAFKAIDDSNGNEFADNEIRGGGQGTPDDAAISIGDVPVLTPDTDATIVEDNEIRDFAGNGIHVAEGREHEVKDNKIRDVTVNGILLQDNSSLIEDNDVARSGQDGISLILPLGGNVINDGVQDNRSRDNGRHGIFVNGNNVTVEDNKVEGNAADGIHLLFDGNRILDNEANENGDNGIFVDGNENQIDDNEANENVDDGLEVSDGTPDNFGGGNEAEENGGIDCNIPVGEPVDCDG